MIMKKIIYLLIAAAWYHLSATAQSIVYFEDDSYPAGMIKTSDENLVVFFSQNVYKLNPEGDIIWSTALLPGPFSGYNEIFELADGSFRYFHQSNLYAITASGTTSLLESFADFVIVKACPAPDGFIVLAEDYIGMTPIFKYFKISESGDILWSFDEPRTKYTDDGRVMWFDGINTTFLRSTISFTFDNWTENLTIYDLLGNIVLDSIMPAGSSSTALKMEDGYLYGNIDFADDILDLRKNNLEHTEQWATIEPGAYTYCFDSLAPLLRLSSGNLIWAIKFWDLASGISGYYCNKYSADGEVIYTSPGILESDPALIDYTLYQGLQLQDNLLAFAGCTSGIDGIQGFVLFTDTSAAMLNLHVAGKIYYDENDNALYDAGELQFKDRLVKSSPTTFYGMTNDEGNYNMNVFLEGSYTNQCILPEYWDLCDPVGYAYDLNPGTSGDTLTPYDYRLSYTTPVTDLDLTVHTSEMAKGWNNQTDLIVNNFGNQTITSVSVTLHFPSINIMMGTEPDFVSFSDTTLTWELTDIDPFETQTITVNFFCDSIDYIPGMIVSFAGSLGDVPDDIDLSNNTDIVFNEVYESLDPNHKEVIPAGTGPEGNIAVETEWLQYEIEFQNTGTYTALNIVVADTLDNDLNFTTFQMLGASHSYWIEPVTPNIIKWHFDNIYLPDSGTDMTGSNGYIVFRIKINPGTPIGTEITNTAAIYFDLNDPVMTNKTINTLSTITGTIEEENINGMLNLSPNPASDECRIRLSGITGPATIGIFDMSGKMIVARAVQAGSDELNISIKTFPEGIYLVRLINTGNLPGAFASLVITR